MSRPSPELPGSRFADIGGPVHYRVWEPVAAAPAGTLVCLHGLGETHATWLPVAPALGRRWRVIALDFPSFGLSPRRGRGGSLADNRRLVEAFLEQECGPGTVLVGSSYGGGVAALVAARRPPQLSALVLSGAFLPPVLGGWKAPLVIPGLLLERFREAGRLVARARRLPRDPFEFGEAALRAAASDPGAVREDVLVALEELRSMAPEDRNIPVVVGQAFASLVAFSTRPGLVRDVYDRIRCPVLMIHGDRDREVPVGWARDQQRRRPEWDLAVLEGLGHISQVEGWRPWLAAVVPWLEGVTTGDEVGR